MKWLFYEKADIDKGRLDGLTIGSSKNEVISFIESQSVSKIRIVHESYFYATHHCLSELDKISNEGVIYVSDKNMRIEAKIHLKSALVSSIEQANGDTYKISIGMPRNELITALKDALSRDKKKSVRQMPSCEAQCVFGLRETLKGGAAASAKAWEFVFPGGNKKYTVYFEEDILKRVRYERQRFAGDGVF